jgi:hypothetical protein
MDNMKKLKQSLVLTILGISMLSVLFACSSESDNASGINQRSAKITADNVQYFVDHLSLGANTSIAEKIVSMAEPMINQLLTNDSNGEITLNCKSSGSITGVPNLNTDGVGTLRLTLEACQIPNKEPEVGLGVADISITQEITLSGSASLQISDFEIFSEGEVLNQETGEVIADGTFGNIVDAVLSFDSLLVETAGRSANLSGTATLTPINETSDELIELQNKRTSEYQIDGVNQQFSRKFRLENFSIVTGVSFNGVQVLPALVIGTIQKIKIPTGTIYDEIEGSVKLVAEKLIQVINQEDGNVIDTKPILELIGADGSRAEFLSYHDNTVTVGIDENGDGDFETRITLPW